MNFATILVAVIVAAVVALDIWYLVRRKRQGKGSCSCGEGDGCSGGGCSGCSGCH